MQIFRPPREQLLEPGPGRRRAPERMALQAGQAPANRLDVRARPGTGRRVSVIQPPACCTYCTGKITLVWPVPDEGKYGVTTSQGAVYWSQPSAP